MIWRGRIMLSLFAGRMLRTSLKGGLVWLVWSRLLLESPRVSKVFESPLLLKSESYSICPIPSLPRKCPSRALLSKHCKAKTEEKWGASSSCSEASIWVWRRVGCAAQGTGVYFDDPNFAIALRDEDKTVSFRRSSRSCRTAPAFQSSPQ